MGAVVGAAVVGAAVVAGAGAVVGAAVGAAVVVVPPPQPCKTTAIPHTIANALIMVDFIFAESQ